MISDKIKISQYQLVTLLTGFMIGSSIILNPAVSAKQDCWLGFLLGWAGGYILIGIYTYIAILNPSKNLVKILKENFGNVFGSIISILYIWYFIHLAALVLRNFGEFIISVTFPETPILFDIVSLSVVILYAVKKGIEVLARYSEVYIGVLVLILLIIFFLVLHEFDWSNFKPVLSRGMSPVFKAGFSTLSFPFGETVIFLMIFPYLNKQQNMFKINYISVTFVGVLLISSIIRNLLVLGTDMMMRDVFPSHMVISQIHINLDPFLDIIFVMGGIVKVGICLYAASVGIKEIFNLEDYSPFVIPITAFTISLSIWVYSNAIEMITWAVEIWPYYSIPFQIVIPIVLLLVSYIKKKKTKI